MVISLGFFQMGLYSNKDLISIFSIDRNASSLHVNSNLPDCVCGRKCAG